MLDTATVENIQAIATKLSVQERLELIRIIAEANPVKPSKVTTKDEWRKKLRDEAAYWYARSDEERQPYLGHIVAVQGHKVVDHDTDRHALSIRVRKNYPNTPVLLTEAETTAPPVFTIRSPRLERNL